VSTDALLPGLLEAAEAEGLAISFHLEPYPGRSAASMREDLLYLMDRVGASPAVLRVGGGRGSSGDNNSSSNSSDGSSSGDGPSSSSSIPKQGLPAFFVYDSYHIPPQDWAALLLPGGELSLRGTPADGESQAGCAGAECSLGQK
jgi:glycoprotein endo-alpha-1,2-mannosidase